MRRALRKLRGKKLDNEEQSANQQQPAPSGSNSLWIRTTRPLDEISSLLAQPASCSTEEAISLVQVTPSAVCRVCYNLDPSQSPPDDNPRRVSWAEAEYRIPDGTRVGKSTVEKSEHLLAAAKGGCLYCNLIATALTGAHPRWETKESFINIFLATGVPIIVRLVFGSMFTVPGGREPLTGVMLRDNRTLNWVVTLQDTQEPPIEIEIYRPRIPMSQLTVGELALERLVHNIGFAQEILGHPRTQGCLEFIKENVGTCIRQHDCGKDGGLPLLPDRVLWVEANNASRIQLLEPKNIRAPYIALSYCWGPVTPDVYLTNAHTLNSRKTGIEFNDLPPLFHDVIDTARALGMEYVWIDRMCIIQGDDADFHSQASKMGEIYGNATLTIAAVTATTENDRILVPRDDKSLGVDLGVDIHGIGSLRFRSRSVSHPLGKEEEGGDYGKMSTRAWVWQERLLAARTVFFTPTALKFECHCYSIWEGFDKCRTGHSWSARLDNVTNLSWTYLVEEYTRRDITRPSDRLPAMEAVMKRIEKSTGLTPLWGLWSNALIEGLMWKAQNRSGLGSHQCRPNPGHYAPTWSWASVDGPISYINVRPLHMIEESEGPVQWDLECRSLNGASGLIRVAGHVTTLELLVTVERNELHEEDPTEHEQFDYHYNIIGRADKRIPFRPDVALKPWNASVNGQHEPTVVRVPYGEVPPTQSWTGLCLWLLVGKSRTMGDGLLLGRSPREPGAWERIGFAGGIIHGPFSNLPRQIIDIV